MVLDCRELCTAGAWKDQERERESVLLGKIKAERLSLLHVVSLFFHSYVAYYFRFF